jgi:hypothetical protein
MKDSIQTLLVQVGQVMEYEREIDDVTGRNFNIFQALEIENYEDRLHSKLLGYLLNPKANHGQGSLFLGKFFETLKIDTDPVGFKVRLEKGTGLVNKEKVEGGIIDILLFNNSDLAFVIENKIYAQEMPNQLKRYKSYLSRFHRSPESKIFFLTLDGKQSKDQEKFDNYIPISYGVHMLDWLEACRIAVIDKPIIRETINQYIKTIKRLTGQNTESTMNDKIFEILDIGGKQKEAYFAILNSFTAYRERSLNQFVENFREKFSSIDGIEISEGEKKLGRKDSNIKINIDGWGFHYIMLYFLSDFSDLAIGIHSDSNPNPTKRVEMYSHLSGTAGFKTKGIGLFLKWWWIAEIPSFPNLNSHQFDSWEKLLSEEYLTELVENIKNMILIAEDVLKDVNQSS